MTQQAYNQGAAPMDSIPPGVDLVTQRFIPSTTPAQLAIGTGLLFALSVGVPAAAGVAAARYGKYSPVKAALVSVGVSIAGGVALGAMGVGVLASNRASLPSVPFLPF